MTEFKNSKDTADRFEQARQEKLNAIKQMGIDPYGGRYDGAEPAVDIKARYKDGEEGQKAKCAGRIVLLRDIGKLIFITLRDSSGPIQVGLSKSLLDSKWSFMKLLELGDIIGASGGLGKTKTGEITIWADEVELLSKSLMQPPEKWHGLADIDLRYRQRYVDLWANPDVMGLFRKRSAILRTVREYLTGRGFMEVETPMMQAIPGGAAAQPFKTHHNALGCDFYMRIALELPLKRMLVGGVDKVFEIGRVFRNEGLSRKHNPEFTMLELYQAYGDYESMMELVQGMVCHVAQKVLGTLKIEHKDVQGKVTKTIDLTPPWRRVKYKDIVREKAGADWFEISAKERRKRAESLGAEIAKDYEDFEVTQAVFEKLIEPTLINPTFVTHAPKELIPLAKVSPDDPTTVEVFECCINGQEIAPAYSEQNDPIEQRERLEHQAGGERQKLDEDFLVALEHGMPPAGGIGIGIDRLCMMLLGQESIRDVILFPQLKPK